MDRIKKLQLYAKKLGFVAEDYTEFYAQCPIVENRVCSPKDVFNMISGYGYNKQESFLVILVDGAHRPIKSIAISTGLVNRTVVHPREVFAPAIEARACAIVIAHNHPSGNITPSPEDIDITRRLVEAGEVIGISVLDHIIIGKNEFFSMVEHGNMPNATGSW